MRFYRQLVKAKELRACSVKVAETDLQILAEKDLRHKALKIVKQLREQLVNYIRRHPEFKTSLVPLEVEAEASQLLKAMAEAGKLAGVGPMAAVAGAMAEFVGRRLLLESKEIIVENGGDIFIRSHRKRTVAIYAGNSPLSLKFGLKIDPAPEGIGVCTSSATVGHSLSLGRADAVVIIAGSAALADAVATATGNQVTRPSRIEPTLNFALAIPGVKGGVIILGDKLGAAGSGFELIPLNSLENNG